MPLPKRRAALAREMNSHTLPGHQNDVRFDNFATDPKFRLPTKKRNKAVLDSRFLRLRGDPEFHSKASVDKYGRAVDKKANRKALAKLYHASDDDIHDGESHDKTYDDHQGDHNVKYSRMRTAKWDNKAHEECQHTGQQGFDPIRDGGLVSSSDETSSGEEDDDNYENAQTDRPEPVGMSGSDVQILTGEYSARLAVVNMDWDNIRASDILAVAQSFVSTEGSILHVAIYPSEFGMERMEREEIEGPPRAIFAPTSYGNKDNITKLEVSEVVTSDNEESRRQPAQGDISEEFDSTALRSYQLDRLRYYYAVITCSSASIAKSIYDNLDGREYLTSANFFDLRFIPDGTEFDQIVRDQCSQLPDDYKPKDFSTDALTHSKVKLTWDAEDTTRQEMQKRAFSQKEIDQNELQAYLCSNSSSSDEEDNTKMCRAASLRKALGLHVSATQFKTKPMASARRKGDVQKPKNELKITFSGGLMKTNKDASVFENDIPLQETTIEKYVRKEKERKQKRKEKSAIEKKAHDAGSRIERTGILPENAVDDDPFNDPFFMSDEEQAAENIKKVQKSAKPRERKLQDEQDQAGQAERANLELLMAGEADADSARQFDMNNILQAEKLKKKKSKKASKDLQITQENFEINTTDPRFAKLYNSHEFAIDPTNSKFKETAGMKAILEEGRKKRKQSRDQHELDTLLLRKKSKLNSIVVEGDVIQLAGRVKDMIKSQ